MEPRNGSPPSCKEESPFLGSFEWGRCRRGLSEISHFQENAVMYPCPKRKQREKTHKKKEEEQTKA